MNSMETMDDADARIFSFHDGNKSKPDDKKVRTRRSLCKTVNRVANKLNANSNSNNKGPKEFSIIGTNANCLVTKHESLMNVLNTFLPSILTIQETFYNKKGMIKLKGYQIFEVIREERKGGGLITAVSDDLSPVLVTDRETSSEILTVQADVNGTSVRIINAYGPQESNDKYNEEILTFWNDLENEVLKYFENKCAVLLQLDANAKVGQ